MLENVKKFNMEKNMIDKAILEELCQNLIINDEIPDADKEDKGLMQVKEIFNRKVKMILALFDGEFEENEDRVRKPINGLNNQSAEQAIYIKVANSALTQRVDKSFEKILDKIPSGSFKKTVAEERRIFIKDFINGNKELVLNKTKEKMQKHGERIEE